jgi:branched-chain amino acid transport system permease protein
VKALRTAAPAMGFALLALVPLVARFGPEAYVLNLASRALVFALAALSLEFTLGHGGLVSFGQAAYVGIGAYAVLILTRWGCDEMLIQAGAAIVAAAVFAALTSAISLRAKGIYYVMSTLAFGQMLYFFFVSLSALGGDDGVTLDARASFAGTQWLAGDRAFYYATLAALALGYLLLDRIVGSRFGRVLGAIRQNPLRVRSLGFEPFGFQLAACVISGGVCAVAGVLLANQNEFVSPAFMSWQRSGDLIVMTVLGGVGSLGGAILGAVAYLLISELMSSFTEHTGLILGPLLVLVALWGRGGLAGLLARLGGGSA